MTRLYFLSFHPPANLSDVTMVTTYLHFLTIFTGYTSEGSIKAFLISFIYYIKCIKLIKYYIVNFFLLDVKRPSVIDRARFPPPIKPMFKELDEMPDILRLLL